MNNFLGKFDCSSGVIQNLYSFGDISVRTSTIKDLLLVDKLQKENSYAVGFIPKTTIESQVWQGSRNFIILICEVNNDAVGYVFITPGKKVDSYAKIQQIAVRNDARRLQYGTALITVCRDFCKEFNRVGFTLRCREDLESNGFWKKIGFNQYGMWSKGKLNHVGFKASKNINLWKIDLNENLPKLFNESEYSLVML